MLKLSACIEMLFPDVSFEERIERTAKSGLTAFEFWGWSKKDLKKVKELSEKHGLTISAMCVDSSDPAATDWTKGVMLNPENQKNYQTAVKDSIKTAKEIGAKSLIATTGNTLTNLPREVQLKSIIDNLKQASKLAEDNGVTIVLEPLNTRTNHFGYFLDSSYEGFFIVQEVNSPAVRLLYDIYHQQVNEGNLIENITKNIDLIGHFHLADVPGRHEPGTGEINWENVFSAIDKTGYKKYLGMEFSPTNKTEDSIKYILKLAGKL